MRTYRSNDDCVVIADEIMAETEKAILCRFGEEEVWLPLSQVIDCSGTKGSVDVSIVLPFWLAKKNELEDYIQD